MLNIDVLLLVLQVLDKSQKHPALVATLKQPRLSLLQQESGTHLKELDKRIQVVVVIPRQLILVRVKGKLPPVHVLQLFLLASKRRVLGREVDLEVLVLLNELPELLEVEGHN